MSSDEARWAAVSTRDKAADGHFYYSVATTGIYCRPSCGSRRPRRENVRFHDTCEAAEAAGFRPCKRCSPRATSPDHRAARLVAAACRMIETAESAPSLPALALSAGLSPFHFHRLFKSMTGVTPKAYATAHRHKRVHEELKQARTVTEAIHDSGFASSGRFYAASTATLGMTPSRYRKGGPSVRLTYALSRCSLGATLVAASDKGIAAILLGDDGETLVRDLEARFPKAMLICGDKDFERLIGKVVGFIDRPAQSFDLPLDVQGTAFQHRVWQALRDIPAGETASYSDIARRIGKPSATRAVAGACGANPAAVAIPCHRVVSSNGTLTGYRWGIERKRILLAREAKSKGRG